MSTPFNPLDQLAFPPEIEADMRALIGTTAAAVWGRGVLEPKTRSLATIAVLCARGQLDELALHVRFGIERNGATREEVCEVVMHCAVYASFPSAVAAFRVVSRVFAEMDAAAEPDTPA